MSRKNDHYRNSLCPCGSGKLHKHCCWRRKPDNQPQPEVEEARLREVLCFFRRWIWAVPASCHTLLLVFFILPEIFSQYPGERTLTDGPWGVHLMNRIDQPISWIFPGDFVGDLLAIAFLGSLQWLGVGLILRHLVRHVRRSVQSMA